MAVIGLVGPHAIGKTTAANRWIGRYAGLVAALADTQWEISQAGKVRSLDWKLDEADKEAAVKRCRERDGVTVIESVRTTQLKYFGPTDPVIMTLCDWTVMDRVLRARKDRLGREFNAEYWNPRKLEEESSKRYLNFAKKYLRPEQVKVFWIKEQAADWEAVDEYFGKLYRKLHNEAIRRRRK